MLVWILTAVREMSGILLKSGMCQEKLLSGKSVQKPFIVAYVLFIQVFSSIQLVLYVNYVFIIIKSLCHIVIFDNNTSTRVI